MDIRLNLTTLFLFLSLTITKSQVIDFEDNNFKERLLEISGIDTNSDGEITMEEAASFNGSLSISSIDAANLNGIEYFTNITELVCSYNNITELDLSNNTLLTKVTCGNNLLTSLNVSENSELLFLDCVGNALTQLDVSKNMKLEQFYCRNNELTSLDVSNNLSLLRLSCSSNQLTQIDITNNELIWNFSCSFNEITTLDLTHNEALQMIYCSNNKLEEIDLSYNKLITYLDCYGNELSNLDLSNNTKLEILYCANNKFPFSVLNNINAYCTPQDNGTSKNIYNELNENVGYTVDYSSESSISGVSTVFTWYHNSSGLSKSNDGVEDLGNGVFKLTSPETYKCKMTNSLFPDLKLWTNNINISTATGINNNEGISIKIYPNPTLDELIIDNQNSIIRNGLIFNSSGVLVQKFNMQANTTSINVSHLTKGNYILKLIDDNEHIITTNFVKL